MIRVVVLAVLLAGCRQLLGFETPTPADDGPDTDATSFCTANQASCTGRNLRTCNSDGTAFASETTCALACDVDHCAQASNLDAAIQITCDTTAPSYTAGANAGIDDNLALGCDGCTAIPVTQRVELGAIDLAYYCLSHFEVPAGLTLDLTRDTGAAILVFVAGDVAIDGKIDLHANSATAASGGFSGGPAAAANAGPGSTGLGPCAGSGGASTPEPGGTLNIGDNVGGGGGGAGGLSVGALGGNGRDNTNNVANGGGGGLSGATCSNATLVPLLGGSGGGGGGDGACSGGSGACGRAGGGGGGAIQIVATGTITIGAAGSIDATGGAGGTNTVATQGPGGGGGGGGGGSVLIEAPTLAIVGSIIVDGGTGGGTANRAGGTGGTLAMLPGAGANFVANGQGGGGAGGSQGRIRLNAKTGATCTTAAVDPCTSAGLTPSP